MRHTIYLLIFLLFSMGVSAQAPDKHSLRIADTLTVQEKSSRYPLLLRSEVDSLIALYNAAQPQQVPQEPVREIVRETIPTSYYLFFIVPMLLLTGILILLFRKQGHLQNKIAGLKKSVLEMKDQEIFSSNAPDIKPVKAGDKKTRLLNDELAKANADKEELHRLLGNYETLKQQIAASYKIRNYPGYEKSKSEEELLGNLLNTERSVAHYAYEHFVKPVIGLADANKNNPARINREDQEKLAELLLSLALFYIEYLYLRVNELSVGGNMVARIKGLSNGNKLDTVLMKELNREHGSRALVLRMMLDKLNVRKLSYPVFDETNLNLS
jgi:hypothetical protein